MLIIYLQVVTQRKINKKTSLSGWKIQRKNWKADQELWSIYLQAI